MPTSAGIGVETIHSDPKRTFRAVTTTPGAGRIRNGRFGAFSGDKQTFGLAR
jgi:hypothetical protein